jgi:hypothetical protein
MSVQPRFNYRTTHTCGPPNTVSVMALAALPLTHPITVLKVSSPRLLETVAGDSFCSLESVYGDYI